MTQVPPIRLSSASATFAPPLARRDPRRAHAARTAADDEEIVVEGHALSPRCRRRCCRSATKSIRSSSTVPVVDVAHLDPPVAMADHHDVADVDEKPVLHHAGDLVQHQRQLPRVADPRAGAGRGCSSPSSVRSGAVAVHPQRHVAVQHVEADAAFPRSAPWWSASRRGSPPPAGERPQAAPLPSPHRRSRSSGRWPWPRSFPATAPPPPPLIRFRLRVKLVRAVDGQVQPLAPRPASTTVIPSSRARSAVRRRGRHAGDPQPLFAHPFGQAAHHPGGGRPGAKPHLHADSTKSTARLAATNLALSIGESSAVMATPCAATRLYQSRRECQRRTVHI